MPKYVGIAFLFFLLLPIKVYAEEVQTGLYIGTKDGNPTPIMAACSDSNSCDFTSVKVGGKGVGGRIDLVFLDGNNNFVGDSTHVITEDTWSFNVTAPAGAKRLRLGIHGGNEAFLMEAVNTKNPSTTYLYTYESPPNSGGGTGGSGGGNGDCDPCSLLSCPGWSDYMGKVDQIIGAIPPPPNWGQVANTFRDSIVPKLIGDMRDMLGTAPNPPSPPPDIPGIATDDFKKNVPKMDEVPGLKDSGFDKNKIENEAPVIEFREDPTGGFDIVDPIESLPDFPNGGEFPVPGETDAGEWGEHTPEEPENEFPIPDESGEVEIGNPPTPIGDIDGPPVPGGGTDGPPVPGAGNFDPPVPGDTGNGDGNTRYKKHPDAPDGSG